jgi:hypothetical protein
VIGMTKEAFDITVNAKLCEIAFICGVLLNDQMKQRDLWELYDDVYSPILTAWMKKEDIRTEEEGSYISAYAERIIKEKYCA